MSNPATTPPGDSSNIAAPVLRDALARPLRDLRISVTDRCNFRCVYCMPRSVFGRDHVFLPRKELLSFEEITRIARRFVNLGVNKIRLTGGEPLLRHGIENLIAMLAQLPGVELTLTTNATLLAQKAVALRDAGLQRVTVSLDAIDEALFRRMSDANCSVSRVLQGIEAATAAGLTPLKVNMVVKRGLNEGQILPMAQHFRGSGCILRFIEYMDVGNSNGWRLDEVVPAAEILRLIGEQHPLQPIDANYPGEVAERWRYSDGGGEIGVISSVTRAFCDSCTRLRLSTEGQLYTCLFASQGHDLRRHLREDADAADAAIDEIITAIWGQRNDRYSQQRLDATPGINKIEMSYIGG